MMKKAQKKTPWQAYQKASCIRLLDCINYNTPDLKSNEGGVVND